LFVKEEEGEERDYVLEATEYLEKHSLQTSPEIAQAIGASKSKVENEALKARPDLFDSITGEGAKAAGRSPRAVLWLLVSGSRPVRPVDESEGGA